MVEPLADHLHVVGDVLLDVLGLDPRLGQLARVDAAVQLVRHLRE